MHLNKLSTSTTYTISLHDALPIYKQQGPRSGGVMNQHFAQNVKVDRVTVARLNLIDISEPSGQLHCVVTLVLQTSPVKVLDRKSTRLNSSHMSISYAVFCLKKKNR